MRAPVLTTDPATERDPEAILALEQTGFVPASRWTDRSWLPELSGGDHFAPAVRDQNGVLQGVASIQLIGDVADLNRVVVDPGHRGRGIGRALIEAGLGWAGSHGGERMLLEVERANDTAIGLYRALGFVPISSRRNYYGAGRDALVMQRELIA